jgi:hypothetical protein
VALAARNFRVARLFNFHRADIQRNSVAGALEAGILMAAEAIGVRHPLRIKDLSDLVRLMAVHTRWQTIGFLFPQFAPDDFAMNRFDLGVAFGTCGSNVPPSDGGSRIRVRQDHVGGVAGDAGGRHDEPFPEQTFTVDALGEIFNDVALVYQSVSLNGCSFLVAFAADERNFQGGHYGARILDRNDVMVPVAIDAVRGQRIAASDGFPVQGAGMLLLLAGVAWAAIHLG